MSVEIPKAVPRSRSDPSPRPMLPPLSSLLNSPPPSMIEDNKEVSANSTPKKVSMSLPSIDHLTSSPCRRALSLPEANTSSASGSDAPNSNAAPKLGPVTPVSAKVLPLPQQQPFFHSTPYAYASTPPLYTAPPAYSYRRQSMPAQTQLPTPQRTQSQIKDQLQQSVPPPSLNQLQRQQQQATETSPSAQHEQKKYAFISHNQATFLSCEPDIDNARLARRKRRRTSPAELAILKEEFRKGSTPNKARRKEIASKVDMTEKAVQIWFQNRRQALRKSKILKKVTVEVPKREELSSADSSLGSLDHDTDSVSTDSAGTSPTNSPLKSNRTRDALNLTSSSPARMSQVPEGKLPPKGVFMTPSKPERQASSGGSPGGNPLTFRFRSTDFFMMNPGKSGSRRQKPTMKLKVKKGSKGPLADKTNVDAGNAGSVAGISKPKAVNRLPNPLAIANNN